MKTRLLIVGVLLLVGPVASSLRAQSFASLPACDCSVFDAGQRPYFASEEQAGRVVGQLLESVLRNSRLSFNDRILVRQAACPSPVALLCPTRLPNGRVRDERIILYNNQFLRSVTRTDSAVTWIDKQVLAHEIGHHVFGDLVSEKTIDAVERLYQTEVGDKPAGLTKRQTSNLHAQELQADFFGLWLLSKTETAFDFDRFAAEFDVKNIRRIEQQSGKNYGLTHPLFRERLDGMRQFWNKLQRDRYRRPVARLGYFAGAASAAYVNLRPEKTYYDVLFVAGLTALGQPRFRTDGAPVAALLYGPEDALNAYVGLSVSRFNWQKPLRMEGDVAWSRQRYGTTVGDGPARRLLETLDLRYLLVAPRLTWSPAGRDRNGALAIRRLGFFIGVGPSVRIPLKFTYQNYAALVNPVNRPDLQGSISGRVSIGVELLKKTFLPRGYKLALHYEPQRIRLRANPQPRMLAHTVDATLSYTFLRR